MDPSRTSSQALEVLADSLRAPAQRKRMLVIVNPHATTTSDNLRTLVLAALAGRFEVEAVDTTAKGHAVALAREAANEGYDLVVAFGGDGTVNEAANGLVGSDTPLSTLPGGSSNVFCRILGIPNDIVDATEHLLGLADGLPTRQVDLGRVDDRWFCFSAGIGLDAAVVERIDERPELKRRYGSWSFALAAVGVFGRHYVRDPPRLEVVVDGEEPVDGVSLFVQNADPYTYFKDVPVHIGQDISLESGDLAGAVLTRGRPWDLPPITARALTKLDVLRARAVAGFSGAHEVRLRSADGRRHPLHVDGDHIADVDAATFSVGAGALRVVG